MSPHCVRRDPQTEQLQGIVEREHKYDAARSLVLVSTKEYIDMWRSWNNQN